MVTPVAIENSRIRNQSLSVAIIAEAEIVSHNMESEVTLSLNLIPRFSL